MSLLDTVTDPVTFESLVGEGKKYRDQEAVAKAIAEKDRFIDQLKLEKAEVLRDLQSRPVVDRSQEILDRMEALAAKPATERQETIPTERAEVKGMTEEDLLRIIEQREVKKRTDSNMDKAKQELIDRFGNEYSSALKSLKEKLGVDQKFLDNLAAQSPTAFTSLLEQIKPTGQSVFTPPSSTNTVFQPSAGGPKRRSEYLRLKAEQPGTYNSPSVQNQMYKDSMTLGEGFFDVLD